MLIKALIISFIIVFLSFYVSNNDNLKINIRENLVNWRVSLTFLMIFLLVFILIPISYYFPHNNGVLGDNYLHFERALLHPGYIKHHHPLFPLIPEKLIRLLTYLKILSVDNPNFLEKAFYWSVFPVSISICVGIGFFSFVLYKKGVSIDGCIIIIALLTTSYGVWLWSLQSNAIGLAIGIELVTVSLFILWNKTKKSLWLILLAISIGTSVFIHNGLIYLSIGSFLSVIFILLFDKELHFQKKIVKAGSFSFVLLTLGVSYYILQAEINHTYDFGKLFLILSDSSYFGTFATSNLDIFGALESNFWSGINWIIGFYYTTKNPYWTSEVVSFQLPNGSLWIKAIQIGSIFALVISIAFNYFKKNKLPSKDMFIFGGINSIIFLIGFTFRQAGTHYYVLALIPNLILFFSFISNTNNEQKTTLSYFVPIVLIILGNIYFNSFTKLSVFEGSNINEHPYYKESSQIIKVSQEESIYFRNMDLDYYPNMAMLAYYKTKFGNITWVNWDDKDNLLEKVHNLISEQRLIFLGKEAHEILRSESQLQFKKLDESIYMIKNTNLPVTVNP